MGETKRTFLRKIVLENLLSFGREAVSLELRDLNLLIGPNGSGKSNLIEAISLLRSTPFSGRATDSDLRGVLRRGGGVEEWVWKGAPDVPAAVEATVDPSGGPLRHVVAFRGGRVGFQLEDERIENAAERPSGRSSFFYRFQQGAPVLHTGTNGTVELAKSIEPNLSILAQRRDPELYPEIFSLVDFYEGIRIYREWSFGRNSVFREPQKADMRNDRLEEDFSNLGLFLSRLQRTPKAKQAILTGLHDLYDGVSDFVIPVEGGTVQVFVSEGDFSIPASRLSDGTLRYLCLLAILCDPDPPPLVCIEEPELGLHPDILPKLAKLLISASERMQLIVTTHSHILVDAMSECPESVVVCEKENGATSLRRLSQPDLAEWLQDYRLGELWSRGHVGGNRW